jgi:hypothetical protein
VFWVRVWVILNPHQVFRVSPEPKPKSSQLGFLPVDSCLGSGGSHEFRLTCHPYVHKKVKHLVEGIKKDRGRKRNKKNYLPSSEILPMHKCSKNIFLNFFAIKNHYFTLEKIPKIFFMHGQNWKFWNREKRRGREEKPSRNSSTISPWIVIEEGKANPKEQRHKIVEVYLRLLLLFSYYY